MRENELEQRRTEMAKILTVLRQQEGVLHEIITRQINNDTHIEELYNQPSFDVNDFDGYRKYSIKLGIDARNQERVIANTKTILEHKQEEVREAHKKVEILKKLKEKQEEEYYKEFLDLEVKEIDDITSARFNIK